MTLKEWRLSRGMTQEELATLIGGECTQALVSKWEARKSAPSRWYRERLQAMSLNVLTPHALSRQHWEIEIRKRQGTLWDRYGGEEGDLREQGAKITTLRGQMSWRCTLLLNGRPVATCRRGEWVSE